MPPSADACAAPAARQAILPVNCRNIVRKTGVLLMSLMVSNEAKPRHTFDPAAMGAIDQHKHGTKGDAVAMG
jgi:hypothetical protein